MNAKSQVMKRFTIVLLLFLQFSMQGQIYTAKVDKDMWSPDVRVQISKDLFNPDVTIQFGSSIPNPDISIGLTDNRYNADFVITDSYVDVNIQYDDDIWSPDFSIKYGDNFYYPDFSIKWVKSGTVNYLIYTNQDFLTPEEIICALLPMINAKMEFQFDALNDAFDALYRD